MNKPTFEEYLAQCAADLGFPGEIAKAESLYRINLTSAARAVEGSVALSGIIDRLKHMRSEYANGDEDLLFYRSDPTIDLTFHQKPFNSAIHKLYRSNVIFNGAFPKDNPRGAKVPSKMYEEIDDLIRSRIICKYMDGPGFVCKKLKEFCDNSGIDCHVRDQSTEAGYYAWHFYFKVPVELSVLNDVGERQIWVELQLSTQLAEAITVLTHGLYEERRQGRGNGRSQGWKWDANSREFRSAYIGHGLHLLEGMIQSFRDDVLSISGPSMSVGALGELDGAIAPKASVADFDVQGQKESSEESGH